MASKEKEKEIGYHCWIETFFPRCDQKEKEIGYHCWIEKRGSDDIPVRRSHRVRQDGSAYDLLLVDGVEVRRVEFPVGGWDTQGGSRGGWTGRWLVDK